MSGAAYPRPLPNASDTLGQARPLGFLLPAGEGGRRPDEEERFVF
ncbi:MAG: hypothetical protein QGF56_12185 [Verrucomicrobiota bacterium]|nr:hypothetical protein [Verrucomicrobiota bacterium]MDP7013617.1 hypothetical protein [Verrucomicrobiota bacterium]